LNRIHAVRGFRISYIISLPPLPDLDAIDAVLDLVGLVGLVGLGGSVGFGLVLVALVVDLAPLDREVTACDEVEAFRFVVFAAGFFFDDAFFLEEVVEDLVPRFFFSEDLCREIFRFFLGGAEDEESLSDELWLSEVSVSSLSEEYSSLSDNARDRLRFLRREGDVGSATDSSLYVL